MDRYSRRSSSSASSRSSSAATSAGISSIASMPAISVEQLHVLLSSRMLALDIRTTNIMSELDCSLDPGRFNATYVFKTPLKDVLKAF